MIGREDHDRVVGHARRLQRVEDPPDRLIDDLVQVVVELPVRQVGGCSAIICGHTDLNSSWHAGRPANESDCEGGSGMSGTVSSDGSKPRSNLYRPPANAMSCGFTNDATASHGPSLAACASSPNNSTTCSANTPSRTVPQSDFEGAMRLTADPPGETERVQPIRLAVRLHRVGDGAAVVVGCHHAFVAARDLQIGVADMPLAAVVGLIPAGAEPVAERRHLVGVEPAHRRIGRLLGDATRLRHPMQGRVLAGEERRPTGHARHRTRVVPVQLDTTIDGRVPEPASGCGETP